MQSITGSGALESKQPSQVEIPVHFARVINSIRLTRLSECYRLSASLEAFPAVLWAVLFVLIKYHFPFFTLSLAFRIGGEFVLSGLLAYLAQRWPGCRILGPCMTSCLVISRSLAALPSTGSPKQSKHGRAKAGSGWYQIQKDVTYAGNSFSNEYDAFLNGDCSRDTRWERPRRQRKTRGTYYLLSDYGAWAEALLFASLKPATGEVCAAEGFPRLGEYDKLAHYR